MNIFISYSSKSRVVVEALAVDLEALGYTVWFDRRLTGGHDWWSEILDSIRRCHLFLFAITPESMESQPCKMEYDYATTLNKRILPVILKDVNIKLLPSVLQKYQLVDYREQNKQQALALGKALNSLPPARAMPKPLPPKPEMPLPPLTKLRDQVDAPSLKSDEQRLIVLKLKEFLEDDSTANDARMLLRRMLEREDLLAKIEKEITALLVVQTPTKIMASKLKRSLLEPCTFTGHSEAVFSVAFSPSGRTILSGSVDKTARLWDTGTGKELQQFIGHEGSVWGVAYAPNGRTILTGSKDTTARLWDSATGRELHKFSGHAAAVWGVAYSPDGRTIITGSFDKTARLWDVVTGKELRHLKGHTSAVWGVTYSPDGSTIFTGSWDATARLWDAVTGKELLKIVGHQGPIVSVAYAPDGCTVLTGSRDKTARLWDLETGKELCQFVGGDIPFGVAFSPDGKNILTGGCDKIARLWDASTGSEICQFIGYQDAVTSVAYAPDGRTILTGSCDKIARLWNVAINNE